MKKKYPLLILIFTMTFYQTIAATEKPRLSDPKIIPVTTKAPEENKTYPIAIIGAGAAGTMAVKRATLNNSEVLLFTGSTVDRRRSRGNWVRKVDNIPGLAKYTRAVLELRNEILEEIIATPLGNNLYVIEDSVLQIEKEKDLFKLTDGARHIYYAKYIVMATGIMDEQPNVQGSIRSILKYANGQTMAYCSLCDGHRCFGKKTIVIGHSEAAAATALLLKEKYQLSSMTILTNGRPIAFSPKLLRKLQEKNISVKEASILEILGDAELKQLSGFLLEDGQTVDAEMGFVNLGIRPNNHLALQLGAKVDGQGLVLTGANGESSIPNLFVAGDIRSGSMRQIYTAWQHAVECLQVIDARLREETCLELSSP